MVASISKANKEISFKKFRRWWKGVNIFEKAYIFLPIHEKHHWSLIIICIPNKEDESGPIILHLDSLGLHSSKSIIQDIKSFLVEEWKFLCQEEVLPELPIPDNIWDNLPRRIDEKVIEVPQQRNEYDCGIFVLFFMERFLEDAPERLKKKDLDMFGKQWFKPEEASSLRRKIRNILKEEFLSANGGDTCKLD
ncbi:sentrin/sumo-specific protease [Striga asiatica]|uniref:Sentrin/sumo-specific protease n=1 Tax=Striga asiatica TaxID=4170 RepID=A0A5A7REB5_STRAF|nr:sentrin/sumo-specific protease [Striga asiatica]